MLLVVVALLLGLWPAAASARAPGVPSGGTSVYLPAAFQIEPLVDVRAVVAGWDHSCALTGAGGVVCWGSNAQGQLGDGTHAGRALPRSVVGLARGVQALAAGTGFTCALTTAGGVLCWGDNRFGQLGDGTTTPRATPVAVQGLGTGVAALEAGYHHACARTTAGQVMCWGSNLTGQLGDGSTGNQRSLPVEVAGLPPGAALLAIGYHHTCASVADGALYCWGGNYQGQLGDGTTSHRATPGAVLGLAGSVVSLAAGGGHTCAVVEGGGVSCWGFNDDGEIGDGTRDNQRPLPVQVVGLPTDVLEIAAGFEYTCARTAAGALFCWGENFLGQLGDGSNIDRSAPVAVVAVAEAVAAVAPGYQHTCALTTAGRVRCWGDNAQGQSGIPSD